jgi:hypothetical protein
MRKVREVPRLRHSLGLSFRRIGEATSVGKTVVGEYVRRAGVLGITWRVPEAIDDAERRLFPVPCETGPPRAATMRPTPAAGEKLVVAYVGDTKPVVTAARRRTRHRPGSHSHSAVAGTEPNLWYVAANSARVPMNEFATKDEFDRLATRVTVIEREVEGEKLVTRHILEQTRRNSDDLAAIKTRLDRVEEKVDGLDRKVDDLTKNLPRIVGDAIREANRGLSGKR